MLTNQDAFSGASAVALMQRQLNQPPPRPSATVPKIPPALDDLIITLMAKSPSDRPKDAATVGSILSEIRGSGGSKRTESITTAAVTAGSGRSWFQRFLDKLRGLTGGRGHASVGGREAVKNH